MYPLYIRLICLLHDKGGCSTAAESFVESAWYLKTCMILFLFVERHALPIYDKALSWASLEQQSLYIPHLALLLCTRSCWIFYKSTVCFFTNDCRCILYTPVDEPRYNVLLG